jgi:flagellar basal-body rod protein FlgC
MSIASTIALSGVNAATLRLQVSASNIANARSDGYRALRVNQVATVGGGTGATVARATATAPTDDGSADARNTTTWEFRANPYVALTNEMVQLLVARFDLAANAKVLHADAQQSAALLDITA